MLVHANINSRRSKKFIGIHRRQRTKITNIAIGIEINFAFSLRNRTDKY